MSDSPLPLSGGSQFNSSTCGVGNKEIGPPLYLRRGGIEIICRLFSTHQQRYTFDLDTESTHGQPPFVGQGQ